MLKNNLKDYLKKSNIKYIADNTVNKGEYLIPDHYGLVVRYDDVEVLIPKSKNWHYSLYKLK